MSAYSLITPQDHGRASTDAVTAVPTPAQAKTGQDMIDDLFDDVDFDDEIYDMVDALQGVDSCFFGTLVYQPQRPHIPYKRFTITKRSDEHFVPVEGSGIVDTNETLLQLTAEDGSITTAHVRDDWRMVDMQENDVVHVIYDTVISTDSRDVVIDNRK
ncbi:hypothetical protein SARC_14914, partial [Sphaeroforma arctica JP610]